jgi:hypothetical protein
MLFRTADVPLNELMAIYQLSLRDPSSAYSEIATYSFPLTPTSIRYEPTELSSFADTQGSPVQKGVARVIDTFGQSPPVITIEGTTGHDRHSSDGYVLTGMQSIQLLGKFLDLYATNNQLRRQAGNPNLYALEWYDFYQTQFYQVQPIGPQIIRQSADRPLLVYYRLRWVALKPVRFPDIALVDVLLSNLSNPIPQVIVNAAQSVNTMLQVYGPTGLAAGQAIGAGLGFIA